SMPGFSVSPDHSLARLKAIQETQRSFGLEVVEALLDGLEAKDKSISFLKNQLAQLANFNPDWDKLEAATDSLREHMAELTAARKRIAELSHHLQNAHEFIEHTEAFGHEASNGILCCGDAQWNIDASKSALSASGFNGEV
ncbi:hypothetical protein ABK774_22430, partial [Enterobacter hormaechei]